MSFDPLLLDLYDAIVSLERWHEVGDLLSRITGLDAAALWTVERGEVTAMTTSEIHRATVGPYLEYFHTLDLWQKNVLKAPRNTVVLTCEHTDESELVRTEFYNDFAREFGLFRAIGAVLPLGAGVHATVSADPASTQQLLSESDKPKFERMIPFIRRALQLRRRLYSDWHGDRLKSAALDAMPFGIVCCEANGRILFANANARQMAATDSGLKLGGALGVGAAVQGEETRLSALIHDAATGGTGGLLRLSTTEGLANLLVLVGPLPIELGATLGIETGAQLGRALVMVRTVKDSQAFGETAVMELFDLTTAQAAIAVQLHSGLSPEDIAAERGVKISTIRTQLNAILQRTGTESLRDLTRLLARVPVLRKSP